MQTRESLFTVLGLAVALGACGAQGASSDDETATDSPDIEAAEVGEVPAPLAVGKSTPAAGPVPDLDITGPPCPTTPTLPRIVRLSEVMGGACNDADALQDLIFDIGQGGKLIVDKTCQLDAGLRLPKRFTLEGTGPGGDGIMTFTHDGIALSICPNAPVVDVIISDMQIYGPYAFPNAGSATHSIGLALANAHMIQLERVRMSGFYVGVQGTKSESVQISHSNISDNRQDNIVVGYLANAWRIRDGLVSQAGRYGINVLGPGDAVPVKEPGTGNLVSASNDLLIDGVRMESNVQAAIRTASYFTRIVNNRFEGNGKAFLPGSLPAVRVEAAATGTRILTNMFQEPVVDCLRNFSATTQQAFNFPAAIGCI